MLSTFYQKIQIIMTLLGLYDGQCDGVWGPKCIEAKRKWEMLDEFEPAVPSNGLPFNGRGKLPKGMHYAYKGLDIIWANWDEERAQAILKEKGALLTCDHVHAHVFGDKTVEEQKAPEHVAVASTVSQQPLQAQVLDTSKIEAEDEPELEDESEEDEEIDAGADDTQNQNRNNHNSNWTKKRK
ncbi:hypothetical protein pEaSNUABM52_00180 [Erwinia phage pEp_SNUABM_52]|nr:hypothetical protein pEaSNUABM52_00180 [Erwinia phage pEp_SNUABM_52]